MASKDISWISGTSTSCMWFMSITLTIYELHRDRCAVIETNWMSLTFSWRHWNSMGSIGIHLVSLNFNAGHRISYSFMYIMWGSSSMRMITLKIQWYSLNTNKLHLKFMDSIWMELVSMEFNTFHRKSKQYSMGISGNQCTVLNINGLHIEEHVMSF